MPTSPGSARISVGCGPCMRCDREVERRVLCVKSLSARQLSFGRNRCSGRRRFGLARNTDPPTCNRVGMRLSGFQYWPRVFAPASLIMRWIWCRWWGRAQTRRNLPTHSQAAPPHCDLRWIAPGVTSIPRWSAVCGPDPDRAAVHPVAEGHAFCAGLQKITRWPTWPNTHRCSLASSERGMPPSVVGQCVIVRNAGAFRQADQLLRVTTDRPSERRTRDRVGIPGRVHDRRSGIFARHGGHVFHQHHRSPGAKGRYLWGLPRRRMANAAGWVGDRRSGVNTSAIITA
jgi:hypothetical protein